MDICWRTRKNAHPKGKSRVYLSCYGPDFKRYSEKIIKQLLGICDCAVYYYPSTAQIKPDDSYRFELERMDLIVIPVTAALLCKPNRTMDFDVGFALERHIPILPLLQEEGLEGIFNHRFGHLQFLREGDSDRTAIPYLEKLETFLKSVLVGNKLADEVRKAFCARIFLSYRKKDRALAQRLMQLIHEDPALRDVAIWYDEFLTPGDDFDKNISDELQNSDLFLLAVTPNLLEPSNYVMTQEYPAANDVLPVLPAQMIPTDREQLKRCYPGISDPVDAYDKEARSERLHAALQERLQVNAEPYHRYLMGIAYLSGIDVEKDPQRAVELLQEAAQERVLEAAEKLAMLYHLGDHVSRDYQEAKLWLKRLVEIAKAAFEEKQNEDSTFDFYWALQKASAICHANMDHRAARMYALQAVAVAEQLYRQYDFSRQLLVNSYRDVGRIFDDCEDHGKALQYRKKAVELEEKLYETERTMKVRRHMVDCYCELADTCQDLERLSDAAVYYGKAEEILQVLAKARKDPELVRELIELHEKLGSILKALGDKRQAKQYAKQADKLFKTYKSELQKGGLTASMSAAAYYLMRQQTGKAIRMMEKAIALAREELEERGAFENRSQLALAYSMMGTLWEVKERDKKAREYYLLSIDVFRQLAEEYPCPQTRYSLLEEYASMGSTYDKTYYFDPEDVFYSDYRLPKKDRQNVEMAYGYYEKALRLLKQVETDQSMPEYKKKEAELVETVGRLHKALGRKSEAIRCYREYRKLCRELFESLQSDISCDRYAEACFRLAMMTLDRELMEEAYYLWTELARRNPNYVKKKKEALRLLNL